MCRVRISWVVVAWCVLGQDCIGWIAVLCISVVVYRSYRLWVVHFCCSELEVVDQVCIYNDNLKNI